MSNKKIEGNCTDSEGDCRNSNCDLGFSESSGASPAKKPKPDCVPSSVECVKETNNSEPQSSLTDEG